MSKRSLEIVGADETPKKAKVETLAIRHEVLDLAVLPQPPLTITVGDLQIDEDFVESGDEAEVMIPRLKDGAGFTLDKYACAVGVTSDQGNEYDGPLPKSVDEVEPLKFIQQYIRNRSNPFTTSKSTIDQDELAAAQPAQIGWVNAASLPEPYRSSWTVVEGHPQTVPAIRSLPASGEAWRKYTKKIFTRTTNDQGVFVATKIHSEGDFSAVEATTRAILPGWRHSVVTFKRSATVKASASSSSSSASSKKSKGSFAIAPVTHWDLKVIQPSLIRALADFRSGIGFSDATGHLELNRRLHRARLVNAFLRASRSILKPSRTLSLIGGDGLTATQSAQKALDEASLLPRARALALQCAAPEAWLSLVASVGTARLTQYQQEMDEIADATRIGRLERARRVQIRNEKAAFGLDQSKVPTSTADKLAQRKAALNAGPTMGLASELSGAQLEHMRRVYPPFNAKTEDANEVYNIGPIFRNVIQSSTAATDIDPHANKVVALIKENSLGGASDEQLKGIADKNGLSVYATSLCASVSLYLLPQIAKAPAGSTLAEQLQNELTEQARLIVVVDWMLKVYVALNRNKAFTKQGVFAAAVQNKCGVPMSVASWMFFNFFCLDQRTGYPTHPGEFLSKYPATFDNGFTKAKWLLAIFATGLVLSPTKSVLLAPLKSDFNCAKIEDLVKQTSSWLQMLGCVRSEGPGIPYTLRAPLTVPLAEGQVKAQLERKAKMGK